VKQMNRCVFAGVVAASLCGAQTLPLSLKQAVEIALQPEGSTRIQVARELIHQAEKRSAQARAALLPNVDSSVSQQSITRNLEAFGIRFEVPVPGFEFPERVGPFNVFDARATLSQTVFDFSSIRRYQASKAGVDAAKADGDNTRDQVAAQVSKAYLAALRAEAGVAAAKANVELAQALLELAQNQKTAGTATGIDVTRARVQLSNEQQRLLVAENQRDRTHLELLRAMDLKLETKLELTEQLSYTPMQDVALEKALETALTSRSDWKAQQRRQENARLNYSGAKMERLPSLVAFADYGTIGSSVHNAIPTRTYGLSLRVPVFDGGRRDARRGETLSQLQEQRIRTADLRQQIELEIRLALDSLHSAQEQVKVAEEGLGLAGNELEQARRRFQAGVTNSVEVTDAQNRLARARDNRIAALFNYGQARVDLMLSMGTIGSLVQ
jgi:outer membrane protein